jgi:hypothetical protein
MNGNKTKTRRADERLEDFAAELARAAYCVALGHGTADSWLDLELDLWRALSDTVRHWEQESLRAAGQPGGAHRGGRDSLGQRRDARWPLSGE